jgi:hypothetical protein
MGADGLDRVILKGDPRQPMPRVILKGDREQQKAQEAARQPQRDRDADREPEAG